MRRLGERQDCLLGLAQGGTQRPPAATHAARRLTTSAHLGRYIIRHLLHAPLLGHVGAAIRYKLR